MYRKLIFLIVALLALMLAGNAAAVGDAPSPASTYTGVLTIVHSDPQDPAASPIEQFYLINATGRWQPLAVDGARATNFDALIGREVVVTARPAEQSAAEPAALDLTSIRLAEDVAATAPLTGNVKWVTLACKFADVAAEPRDITYFRNMYASTYPGLDYYYREASYDAMNVTGSTAFGWYTLPKPKSAYQINNFNLKWVELLIDCAAKANTDVNFADYYGIHLMLNEAAHGYATTTSLNVTLDGVTRNWPTTFMPPWGYNTLAVVQHEMTHGLGIWWHSAVGKDEYGDPWDVMGDLKDRCGETPPFHPIYGCVGQHTQIFNRDVLGWVPAGRKVVVSPGVTTLTLERATQPGSTGYLMAIVPINGSTTHRYVIEARQRVGYDVKLAGSSITIHEIGGPNTYVELMDQILVAGGWGHMWAVGDTWYAPRGNLSVHVDAATPTGFTITIDTNWETRTMALLPTGDTTLDQTAPNANFGSDPQLRIEGSYNNANGATKAAFLKFDPTGLPPRIVTARLKLFSAAAVDMSQFMVSTGSMPTGGFATPWDERGLTWNSFHSYGWMTGVPNVYQPLNTGMWWFEFDITGIIAYGGPTTLNALMIDDGRDQPLVLLSSREGPNPPQLNIEYLVPLDETTTTTFTPTNDATVSQAKPKLVSGAKLTLQVKDAAKDFNAFVKFNVTGLTGTVQSATLRLFVKDPGPDGGRVYATSPLYKNTTTQWLETGVNWNNAPLITGTPLDAAGKVVLGEWVELNVTSAVTGNGRVSFALTNDSRNLVTYSSKEGAHAPELVVVTN